MGTNIVHESQEGSSEKGVQKLHVKMAGALPGVRMGGGFLNSGHQHLRWSLGLQ